MKKTTLIFLLAIVCCRFATAQNPFLIADLDTTSIVATVENGAPIYLLNNQLLFDVIDNTGDKLWKSDGTQEGTFRAVNPPVLSNNAVELNGYLIYSSNNISSSSFPNTLWKTNGAQTGTSKLADVSGNFFFKSNGIVFFNGTDPAHGAELWKTDGTSAGTQLVKDILPGTDGSSPLIAAATLNNLVIFTTNVFAQLDVLYVTDGTEAGTQLLKDMSIGDGFTKIENLVTYSNAVYFMANASDVGQSLWKTDGTLSGTVMVKDFDPTVTKNEAGKIVIANGKMFMIAFDSEHNRELWVSDGTAAGTQLVKDIRPGDKPSLPISDGAHLTAVGDKVYFVANVSSNQYQPWVSDGTPAGTMQVATLPNYYSALDDDIFFPYQNEVLMVHLNAPGTVQFYLTDGTPAGTQLITQLPDLDFMNFINFNGKVYFDTQTSGTLWQTDGTAAGTFSFSFPTDQTASSLPLAVTKISENKFLFTAAPEHNLYEWYVTDANGENLINLGLPPSGIVLLYPESNGSKAFFVRDSIVGGFSTSFLYTTDGTPAGTLLLTQLYATPDLSRGDEILNGILYFINGTIYSTNSELWRSDGTVAGTYMVKNIIPSQNDNVGFLTQLNGELYFAAKGVGTGTELWMSDGTDAGTVLVKDIRSGNPSSNPTNITAANGHLYFSADDGVTGEELYISDGTSAGTYLLKDIRVPNGKSSFPNSFTASGNYVFFTADDGIHGTELWRTDGTSAGTMLAEDLTPGKTGSEFGRLIDLNGTLIYSAAGGIREISGTGTSQLLKDNVLIGTSFKEVNNVLYFAGTDNHVWRTDGTVCHTQMVDFFPEVTDESPNLLASDGNKIFLSLNSELYGEELWIYTTSPITNYEICNGFDDDCNGLVDDGALTATISPSGIINACNGALVVLNASPTGEDLKYSWYYNGNIINGVTTSSLSSSTLGGSVEVVINADFGCTDTSDATIVNRIPLPKAKITPQGNLDICTTGSVILKANSGSGYSYQWQLNNAVIAGATKKQYTATATGNYKVSVTNSDNCSKTSNKVTVFTSCKEPDGRNVLTIALDLAYPNPFRDVTHVDLSKLGWSDDQLEVRITDLSGRILFSETFSSHDKIEIGDDLSNGFYLLEVKGKNQRQVIPVVKQ